MDNCRSTQNEAYTNKVEFVQYVTRQRVEIEKHKWIESERVGYDLGDVAVQDWINKYAKKYRDNYNISH